MKIVLRTEKFKSFHMQGEEAIMQEIHGMLTQIERNIPNKAGK